MMISLKTNVQQSNFYVITGGPGVGKTTLIEELSRLGFHTVEEDARKIIKQQMRIDRYGLPWKNKELYVQLMFQASVQAYQCVESSELTFFDRGIPDALCYSEMENLAVSKEFQSFIDRFRYNKTVFILPPWKEIYENDYERKQSWNEAENTFEAMRKTYKACGYFPIEVPKMEVHKRAQFVTEIIKNMQ